MEKIKKLRLSSILEGRAITEDNEGGSKIKAISIGATIGVKKADGASALFIDSVATEPIRYNKVEQKDLEIETLQNELAGVIGQFDGQVHKLMAKYGYEWISPEDAVTDPNPISTMESINEAGEGDPTYTFVGDYLVLETISISKLVDAAADHYDFDNQELENKFRSKVKEIIHNNSGEIATMIKAGDDIADVMYELIDNSGEALAEFEYYK